VKEERKGRSIHVVAGVEAFGVGGYVRSRGCATGIPYTLFSIYFFPVFIFLAPPRLRMDEWMEKGWVVAAE